MIISHKYKFIFIKTRKTAGTSIEVFLSNVCGEKDVVTPIYPHVSPHYSRNYMGLFNPIPELTRAHLREKVNILKRLALLERYYNHMSALTVRERIGSEIWNSYYKFCVERNPWDKTLSAYYMDKYVWGSLLSLDQFIDQECFWSDFPSYTDSVGRLLMDRVIRFERLNDDLAGVFQRLKIPFNGSLGVKAKGDYRKKKQPYREVLTSSQREKIAFVFRNEIQKFGYTY